VEFEWPALLWGLLLVPLAVAVYVGLERRRAREATGFGNPALWPNILPRSPGWRRHVPGVLLLFALTALLVSLARPHTVLAVDAEEGTVILAMDTSYSMRATDVQPNRLAAARAAAELLIGALPDGYRLGVVTFAGQAEVGTAPTTDRDMVRTVLDNARAQGGTAIGSAIERSLELGGALPSPQRPGQPQAIPDRPPERTAPLTVLLLSDGYSTEGPPPLSVALLAQQARVPVHTVALGTQSGLGPRGIPAPPDLATLERIADLTGGHFLAAPDAGALREIYAELGSQVSKVDQRQEVTVAGLAAALVLAAAGGAASLVWFRRPV
jgi:Ca-activated chloride channel family protein